MRSNGEFASKWEERLRDPAYVAEMEAAEKRRKEKAAAELEKAQRRHLERMELPERPLRLILAGAATKSQAVEALERPWSLLVMSGRPGTGKTLAACLWLARYVQDAKNWEEDTFRFKGSAVFLTAERLSRWSRYDDAAMEKLYKAKRLVLDDLGVEYLDEKGAYASILDALIDARYSSMRPTILTTNLTGQAFKERYGERIADRLRDEGSLFVALGQTSMRRKP
jgi:DNA replication protein DnaC